MHPSLTINGCANDHSIRKSFKANSRQDEMSTIGTIESSLTNISKWMDSMRLKLNEEKTEFILFGYRTQLSKCATHSLKVNSNLIQKSTDVCYLGVTLDNSLTFKTHVTAKCRKAMANLINIRNIRKYLTQTACETVVLGLCMSHLGYCNSLLIDLPDKTIDKPESPDFCNKNVH